jgi:hypothetical protein
MNQSFTYRRKYSSNFVLMAVAGVAGIGYSLVQPFSLGYRRHVILEAPHSNYAVIVVGALFIAYAIHKFFQMRATNTATAPIAVTDAGMTFPYVSGYTATPTTVSFPLVNELWSKSDEDDGESVVLYVENSKYRFEFFAEHFENPERFSEFRSLLEQHCTNITNRERAGA